MQKLVLLRKKEELTPLCSPLSIVQELVLLEKEKELLEKEQTVMVLREEVSGRVDGWVGWMHGMGWRLHGQMRGWDVFSLSAALRLKVQRRAWHVVACFRLSRRSSDLPAHLPTPPLSPAAGD